MAIDDCASGDVKPERCEGTTSSIHAGSDTVLLHADAHLAVAGRVDQIAALPDRSFIDKLGDDDPQSGTVAGHGGLENRRVPHPRGPDDRIAGNAHVVAHDRADVHGDPELDPGGGRVGPVVLTQGNWKHGPEVLQHLSRRDVRRNDDQEPVATVLTGTFVPDAVQGEMRHFQDRAPDDPAVIAGPGQRTEFCDVGDDDGTVLPVQGLRAVPGNALLRPTAAHYQVRRRRGGGRRAIMARARGGVFGQPFVDLAFHDLQDSRVRTYEGGEIFGLDHECPYFLQCDDGGRAHAHLQGGALTDQLPRPPFGDDPLGAVRVRTDLRPAAEDDDDVISGLASAHEPRATGKRPLLGERPERVPFGGAERVPEVDGGAGSRRLLFSWVIHGGRHLR